MDEFQRQMVLAYRLEGYGYKAISRETGLPRDKIRNVCRSNGLGGVAPQRRKGIWGWENSRGRCLSCGKRIEQPKRGRTKRFCSGACRTRYWRAVRREEEENEFYGKLSPGRYIH